MYRADAQLAVVQELRQPQALGSGVGEVDRVAHATFEQIQVVRAADAGDEHVQVVNFLGSTSARLRDRKSACFWLSPSRATRSPGALSASQAGMISSVGGTRPRATLATPVQAASLVFAADVPAGVHRIQNRPSRQCRPLARPPREILAEVGFADPPLK